MSSLRFPAARPAAPAVFAALGLLGAAALGGAGGCAGSGDSPGFGDAGTKKDASVPIIGDDDDDDDDNGGDGGLGLVGDDSGPLGDDDDDGGGDAGLLGPSYGSIALAQTEATGGAYSYTLTVGFSLTAGTGATCTTQTLTPACVLSTCTGTATAGAPVSAGAITVGDADGGATATATPSGNTYPAPTPTTGQLFQPGDLLTANGAGASGGIAAFSAQAIGPNEIAVTTPASLTGASFPRSTPLTVAWGNGFDGTGDPGSSTKVQVVVATSNAGTTKTVTCSFAASEESATVPLSGSDGTYIDQAGTGGVTGTLSLTPTSTTEVVAGTRAVTFTVTAGAHTGTFTSTD
jgi:hypothetical protein